MRKLWMGLLSVLLIGGLGLSFVSCGSKKAAPTTPSSAGPSGPAVLYIYGSNTTAAGNYQSLLNGNGYNVTTMTLSNAINATLANYSLFIFSDDSQAVTAMAYDTLVTNIFDSGKPVVGIGAGGGGYFQQVGVTSIGSTNLYAFPSISVTAVNQTSNFWYSPNAIPPTGNLALYSSSVSCLAPYFASTPVSGTILVGQAIGSYVGYYPLALCYSGTAAYFFWGFEGDPSGMTVTGKNLFLNAMKNVQAAPPLLINYTDFPGTISTTSIPAGFDITPYPGTSLNSIVMWVYGSAAGSYSFGLTAYSGCFNGTILGTTFTPPVTLNGSTRMPVTFTFSGDPAITFGSTVAFALSQSTGPLGSTSSYSNAGNTPGLSGSAILNNELNNTGCPLSVNSFNGFSLLVTGTP
jgi:hypothetical protein